MQRKDLVKRKVLSKKLLISLLIGSCLLSGCGNSEATGGKYATNTMAMATASATAEDYYYDSEEINYDDIGAYDDDYYAEYEEVETSLEKGTDASTVTFDQGKKIIYSSNVVLETKTYEETYNRLVQLINENGGYIEYESYDNTKRSYLADNSGQGVIIIATNNLTIRIPSKNYTTFMQDGLTLGNVLRRNQTIEDKTSEYNTNKSYVDILNDEAEYLAKQLNVLEAELKTAQANDKHYDEIIDNMKDIAERKAQVEKELVPFKRTMDDIDEKVEYSTIVMELREVDKFTVVEQEEEEEDPFITQLKDTWNNSMKTLGNMLKGTVLFLIRILPALIYLAIFGLIVFAIIKLIIISGRKKALKKALKNTSAKGVPAEVVNNTNVPEPSDDNASESANNNSDN